MKRRGVSAEVARREVSRRTTLIGALLIRKGEADAMVCGSFGHYHLHLGYIKDVIGMKEGVKTLAAMNALMLPTGNIFIADTYVNPNPTAEQIADITELAATEMKKFGIVPKAALLSHSNFGSSDSDSATKMRDALDLIQERLPNLEVDGEMQGDAALIEHIRNEALPSNTLKGSANLLIMPNVEAANISYNLLRVSAADGVTIGPILMGAAKPVHIVTAISSVRRIVNMVALAAVGAQNNS